ncbi:MAG: homogentisate 1,2-dioxygenase, partial [Bacteroidetes bacterium]
MPIYHTLGQIPPKRHTIFTKPDSTLYHEQLFGTIGFDGMSSLLYHHYRPTMVKAIGEAVDVSPKITVAKNLTARKLIGFKVAPQDDFLAAREPLLVNSDIHIGVAAPRQSLRDYFYKNADADELLFIHQGSGTLRTMFGQIPFEYGDYLVIPRGMIYQIDFDTEQNRILYAESFHPIYTPKRYRNDFGQLL